MEKIKAIIKEQYEQMKSESATYGELRERINKKLKDEAWGSPGALPQAIHEELIKLYEEEMGGLPINPPAAD